MHVRLFLSLFLVCFVIGLSSDANLQIEIKSPRNPAVILTLLSNSNPEKPLSKEELKLFLSVNQSLSSHWFLNPRERESYYASNGTLALYATRSPLTKLKVLHVVLDSQQFPSLIDLPFLKGAILAALNRPVQYTANRLESAAVLSSLFIVTKGFASNSDFEVALQKIQSYSSKPQSKLIVYDTSKFINLLQVPTYLEVASKVTYLMVQAFHHKFVEVPNIILIPVEYDYQPVNSKSLLPAGLRQHFCVYFGQNHDIKALVREHKSFSGVIVDRDHGLLVEMELRNSIFSICSTASCVFQSLQFAAVPIFYSNAIEKDRLTMNAEVPFIWANSIDRLIKILKHLHARPEEYGAMHYVVRNWYPEFIKSLQRRSQILVDTMIGDVEIKR